MLNNLNQDNIQSGKKRQSLIELYTNIQILQKEISIKLNEIEEEE